MVARHIDFGNSPGKLGGSEEGVGNGAFSGRRVPSALQCLHACVSLVVVCVSKKPKTFSSEMKYVTQMTELETGQRAMMKAILLISNRKVSFRYRVPALVLRTFAGCAFWLWPRICVVAHFLRYSRSFSRSVFRCPVFHW